MKKYSFLVYHRDYPAFLSELQELGILDILEHQAEQDPDLQDKLMLVRQLQNTIKALSVRKQVPDEAGTDEVGGIGVLERVLELEAEAEKLRHQLAILRKEQVQSAPWGTFSQERILQLKEAGVRVRLFTCPEKRFHPVWPVKYPLSVISSRHGKKYFVVVETDTAFDETGAEEMKLPDRPVDEVIREQREVAERMEGIDRLLDEMARKGIPALKRSLYELQNEVDHKKAMIHTLREADSKLMIIEGWVPADREKMLERIFQDKDYVYLIRRPERTEKPSVLLKNNHFSRLFEPIGNLFSLPDYHELDLTPFFAPFFMMFFGFCLGDAGYGLLFILGATIVKLTRGKQIARFRSILTLIQWLGLGTVIFGILTGTFFGVQLMEVEQLGNFRRIMLDNDKAFNLALILGAVQILAGTAIRAVNQYRQNGWQYSLSPIGWILLLLGLADTFLLKLTGAFGQVMIYISLFLIVVFSDPGLGIFGRIGKGLWDLYGITGIFGDLLSYIRLFALGASGAILGFVINDIALQLLSTGPVIGHLLFVVFLLLGHTLVIAISSLGAFVHPMRLTFVEFYKNSGFTGGGKKYNPFSLKK
jgi:V/A-type H+-transporting ATPase subunit I